MKTSEQSYNVFNILCISLPGSSWMKFRNALLSLLAFALIFAAWILSFIFIVKHLTTDLAKSLFASVQIGTATEGISTIIPAYIPHKDLSMIF